MKRIPGLLLLMFITVSCIKDLVCLNASGPVITEYRDASEIDEIINTTSVDVVYMKADTVSISLRGAANLNRHIVTNVTNGRLEIRTDPRNTCFDRGDEPEILITSPQVHSLDMTGSGSLNADSLSGVSVSIRVTGSGDLQAGFILTDELGIEVTGSGDAEASEVLSQAVDLTVTGSGDLSISGSAASGVMRLTGSGNIRSENLELNTGILTITASGDIHANIIDALTAVISGSGNIYLRGRPAINQTITGSGKIIPE